MIRPKQFARMGEFYLEEAVLDVLLEAKYENECIGPAELSKRTGIFAEAGHSMKSGNDAIVWGVLGKLAKFKRVRKCTQSNGLGGWELTDSEFNSRRDDVS